LGAEGKQTPWGKDVTCQGPSSKKQERGKTKEENGGEKRIAMHAQNSRVKEGTGIEVALVEKKGNIDSYHKSREGKIDGQMEACRNKKRPQGERAANSARVAENISREQGGGGGKVV